MIHWLAGTRAAARAGWHKAKALIWPTNVRPLFIPAGCPELNAQENIWQYMRQTWLSNRVFAGYGYTEIIDATCDAWKRLLRIASIATRDWVLEPIAPP